MQIFDIVEELEKERKKNKELEELCNKYEEEHKTTFKIWQKDIQANKKAIEKVKAIQFNANKYGAEHDVIVCEELLGILKGDNK